MNPKKKSTSKKKPKVEDPWTEPMGSLAPLPQFEEPPIDDDMVDEFNPNYFVPRCPACGGEGDACCNYSIEQNT